ncbi:hypothetical protein BDV25DRAFT_152601 [Aspergillus avenaceus]|uniref:Uncharacterized protein n=1 Tax=Aspergillus avenaceus TaxID=36643 RepID=A0A5N6TZH0_ASPAV|nr:hypothetical protein BDV25DRAFT_152601 [Aspergillus avenaceus]
MINFSQVISLIYSTLTICLVIVIGFALIGHTMVHYHLLPASHPIRTAGRLLWSFLNSQLLSQAIGYSFLSIALTRSLVPEMRKMCPNPCSSRVSLRLDHQDISNIVSAAVKSAMAEATGVNKGYTQ